jgi:arginyl-tRNA synthetase
VLKAEKEVKVARLALIRAVSIVLRNGLNLLGIEVLEKM